MPHRRLDRCRIDATLTAHPYKLVGDEIVEDRKIGHSQLFLQPSVSHRAACALLNGLLLTCESGDDIYQSQVMNPEFRKCMTQTNIENCPVTGFVKIYKPVLFHRIRHATGMNEQNYYSCLDFEKVGMNCLTDSDSKSGQSFWISKNEKIVLKTIKKYECKNLQRILDDYSDHIIACEGKSCISTVLGLYRVILKSGGKRYFMVSRNVYPESNINEINQNVDNTLIIDQNNENLNIDINENKNENNINMKSNVLAKFDLKGSTVGRKASLTSSVMKDLDLIGFNILFPLGESVRKTVLQTLEKDVLFLRKHSFMDYSLLVAVENTGTPGVRAPSELNTNTRFVNGFSVLKSDR